MLIVEVSRNRIASSCLRQTAKRTIVPNKRLNTHSRPRHTQSLILASNRRPNPYPNPIMGSRDDSRDGRASSAGPLARLASLARHLVSHSPMSTSATSSRSIGELKLGPDVSIPVFEPHDPLRLPMQRLLLNLEDPIVLSDLTWMAKKWQLSQDMFLLSHPGSYSRRLALTFASLLQLPYEYISMHRDIGEGELLQQRSLRAGGSLIYQDGPVVRAMKSGSLLIIEGVQRAERNVMPLLNNILENREANLADGTQLVPAARLASVKEEGNDASRLIAVHPNFRVVALGLPTPPYQGLSLDPPFRSRFQSRWVESHQSYSGPSFPFTITPADSEAAELVTKLIQRLHEFASLTRYHDRFAAGAGVLPETERLPTMPSTMLPLLEVITELFPPVTPLAPPPTSAASEEAIEDREPPQDGALQVAAHTRRKVEAKELEMLSRFSAPRLDGKIAHETRALLGSAYPNLYTLDRARKRVADSLLENLGLDHGVGAGSTGEADLGGGMMSYQLQSVTRLDEVTASLRFTHAGHERQAVTVEVPCGPLPFVDVPARNTTITLNGDSVQVTPRLLSIVTTMAQLHAANRDIALLPSAFAAVEGVTPQSSSSTATAIALFGSLFGYPIESLYLWKDVGGTELVMRRVTSPEGDTTFEPSPLVKGAMEAKIVHLANIDVLGPTLGSLASLLQDRSVELWHGGRASLTDATSSKFEEVSVGLGKLTPLHPSFRVIATSSSSKSDWLNEEVSTLFGFVAPSPMTEAEERDIILRRSGCPEDRLSRLFAFTKRYRELSSDPTLGLEKGRRLGTRSLIRIAQRIAKYPADTDLRSLLERTLLVDFLPRSNRDLVRNCLGECGIYARGSEGAFQYVAPSFLADPRVEAGQLRFEDLNNEDTKSRFVDLPVFNAAQEGDAEGAESLIPSSGNFFDNPNQSLLLRDLGMDLQTEHILLLGNQGVGKNKIIDRLCELLRRPREYIQLSRDSTVNSILQIVQLEQGRLLYLDSPLIRAIKLGRLCVVDEADKCSAAVTAVFKSLMERGQLSLPDGRQVRPMGSVGSDDDVLVHPNFRCILLANRPGFPFLGNEFISSVGEGLSPFAVNNPDLNSEVRLLSQAAPKVDVDLIKRLDLAFHDLRLQFDAGTISYPYSLRELLAIVKHLNKYPDEALVDALLNVVSFDLHRPQSLEIVVAALRRRGLDVKGLTIGEIREAREEETRKALSNKGKVDFDPIKAGKDTSLDQPKEGKTDPKNEEHHGGNTWRGGTGGRDTAGLGGRGGYERLRSGHEVKQISDELKRDVPEHIKEQARRMAQEALAKKLANEGVTQHEAATLESYRRELEAPINHLVNVLNDLQANKKERAWLTRQQEGELDERRLTNALTGERSVFKRRQEAPPEVGAPQTKPKRIRFLVDCSASMYSVGDGRLDREVKTVLMIMEAFSRIPDGKFAYDIIGHSGESHELPLVTLDKIPDNAGKRWKVMRDIVSTTQFTMSGDNTVECLEHAVKTLPKAGKADGSSEEDFDDFIVIALSDANLSRYGITSKTLLRAMSRNQKVKSAILFIGGEEEGRRCQKEMPGKAYVCNDLKMLPILMSEILVAMVGREGH